MQQLAMLWLWRLEAAEAAVDLARREMRPVQQDLRAQNGGSALCGGFDDRIAGRDVRRGDIDSARRRLVRSRPRGAMPAGPPPAPSPDLPERRRPTVAPGWDRCRPVDDYFFVFF